MHNYEDKDSPNPSAGTENASAGDNGSVAPLQTRASERRMSKEEQEQQDTFLSANDLNSFLLDSSQTSQTSTSSGDSNSSSSYHYSSSTTSAECCSSVSTSTSLSTSAHSSSSSEKSGEGVVGLSEKSGGAESISNVSVTNNTISSSSSTTSASTVRRSESWTALRSVSLDSSKSGGSEPDLLGEFKIREPEPIDPSATHPHPDSYHTPSASMHSISANRSHLENLPLNLALDVKETKRSAKKKKKSKKADTEESSQPQGEKIPIVVEPSDEQTESPGRKTSTGERDSQNRDKDDTVSEVIGLSPVSEKEHSGIILDVQELASISSESNTSKDSSNLNFSIGPPSAKQLAKAAKLARKPAKKRNWYQHIFTASYKSRSGDFKKLFKELPIKERLLVDYSCALQKEILVQGRMYLSQGYLSFHANIFGWETQTSLRMRDITSLTKEKTALVIPNAIQVVTEQGDKLFFTSFVTRDATFLMLFKLWQNSLLEDSLPSKEIQRLIHSSYGEELVITSDDEIDDGDGSELVTDFVDGIDVDDAQSIVIDSPVTPSDSLSPTSAIIGNIPLAVRKQHEENQLLGLSPVSLEPSDLSESSESDDEFQVAVENFEMEVPKCPVNHAEGKETINAIIPCNIDQLFTMLFTNSKFYLDFHTSRKTSNINQSPWEIGKDGKQTRQVAMTVSLNAVMGPKHSQVTETQVMHPNSKPGLLYVIDSESVNAGVPYADTFYVTCHYCLSRVNAVESRLIVVNQVKYRKSIFGITKSIIEKNCWAGMEEFYSHLEKALKEECAKMLSGSSPLPSPKHTTNSLPRRRPPRTNKRKAPDPPHQTTRIRTAKITDTMSAALPEGNVDVTASATSEGSVVLKIILGILCGLLFLNAFLYFKLTYLESTATSTALFPPPTFTITGEIPQNHQDWLHLLEKQESLHRIELQKWHEILMSALKILHQAESDLETLKLHIGSYSGGKYSVDLGQIASKIHQTEDPQKQAETANHQQEL